MARFFAQRARQIHLVLAIDASGSMLDWESEVRNGLRRFTAELDSAVPWRITLIMFNGNVKILGIEDSAANLAASRTIGEYKADGGTALWDALAAALHTETAGEPTLLIVATDGEDTMSREHQLSDVSKLVERRRSDGNWSFLWLNMTGSWSSHASELGFECLDFHQRDIVRILLDIARRLGQAAAQLRLEGGSRLPDLLLLG